MRNTVFILLFLMTGIWQPAVAQNRNWYSYYNAKTGLYGFKDGSGKVKIPARFNDLIRANRFRNIVAVMEGESGKSYYLLKNGQKVARDSLFVWDMSYDCEQEGKIRFHDPVTDKVGFLDQNGQVKIPAVYNDAQPFYNGLALVIHNGKRICADGKPFNKDSCEHWSWNGTTALIDTNGVILADSIDVTKTENLNWYTLKTTTQPADTALYTSFKAKKNGFYNFINYEKEFKNWFYQQFLSGLNQKKMSGYCFQEVTVEGLFKHT
ncbi:MAG: WG repeat-containing protein, partial [Sphingobacteriaceae bacterium]